jgi:hypothetical protein
MKSVKLSLLAALLLGAVACQKSNTLSPAKSTTPTVSGSMTTDDAVLFIQIPFRDKAVQARNTPSIIS